MKPLNADVIFSKIILFTCQLYIQHDIDDGYNQSEQDHKLVAGIENYRRMGRFSKEEHAIIKDIGEHEYMQKLKNQVVSRTVVALELMKLWVETTSRASRKGIHLGVGNRKLQMGAATFTIDLIKMKNQDKEKYGRVKNIVTESKVNAKQYFSYVQEHIKEGVKEWNLENIK